RLPSYLPRPFGPRSTPSGDLDVSLAAVPSRVRRRIDQAPRRPMLARPDLPLLPPGDAAHAEPAQLVLPPSPRTAPQGRGSRESLCPVGCTNRTGLSTTHVRCRGRRKRRPA